MRRLLDIGVLAPRSRLRLPQRVLVPVCALALQGCAAFCLPVDRPSPRRDYLASYFYETYFIRDINGYYRTQYGYRVDLITTLVQRHWKGKEFKSLLDVHGFAAQNNLHCESASGSPSESGSGRSAAPALRDLSCRYVAYREGDPVLSFPKCEYDVITTVVEFKAEPQGRYRIADVRMERSTLVEPRGTTVKG